MTEMPPEPVTTDEYCQAREVVMHRAGPEYRICCEAATGRLNGTLYCDYHLELCGWIRKEDTDA
jgi:hypothetical protein